MASSVTSREVPQAEVSAALDVAEEMQRLRAQVRKLMRADEKRQVAETTPTLEWRELRGLLKEASERWRVKELPFTSSAPVVGSLIALFRSAWNSVAAKWHVRRILLQQNDYNQTVFRMLQELSEVAERLERSNRALRDQVTSLEDRLRMLEAQANGSDRSDASD